MPRSSPRSGPIPPGPRRGEDSLTLRFGADQSITFTGVGGAAAIGVVTGFAPAEGIALVHQAPGLDLSV